jgi:acyl-CoA reductase-like NAD-dependent aldehyde dehydrogenase
VTTVDSAPVEAGAMETFESVNPATGEPVGRFPMHDEAAVRAAVAAARPAAQWWEALGYDARADRLTQWRGLIAGRLAGLAELMHRENGKPVDDATIEVASALEHITWAAKHAQKVLGKRSVRAGVLAMNHKATLEYQPYGVVGVIGPWNYPVFTPMGSIIYALAAGNAVVFKPSEFTPAIGEWLVRVFAEVVPEHPVLQLVTGLGATGAALCASGVDKLAFTGSTATGRKVMAACAPTLTPVVIECGGKDAMIVDADADLDAAAAGALWGGLSNAGQTCIGVERVYAVDSVYDQLVAKLTEKAVGLRSGSDREASYGPMTMPSQVDVVRRHVADALEKGGRAVVGGPASVGEAFIEPVVLVDVPEDSSAVQEETFGPTLTVARVPDIEEAIRRANDTPYGLGASVYSKSRGEAIARRVRSGMASVNSVLTYAGVAGLPFGGVGDSGFGRIHGEDGLREFARSKAITRQRFTAPVDVTSFWRKDNAMRRLGTTIQLVYGRGARRKD